jgi:hypothetical protein
MEGLRLSKRRRKVIACNAGEGIDSCRYSNHHKDDCMIGTFKKCRMEVRVRA